MEKEIHIDDQVIMIDPNKRYKISEVAKLANVPDYIVRNLEKYTRLKFPVDEANVKYLKEEQIRAVFIAIRLKDVEGLSYAAIDKVLENRNIIDIVNEESVANTAISQLTPHELVSALQESIQNMVSNELKYEIDNILTQKVNQVVSAKDKEIDLLKNTVEKLIKENRELREYDLKHKKEQSSRDILLTKAIRSSLNRNRKFSLFGRNKENPEDDVLDNLINKLHKEEQSTIKKLESLQNSKGNESIEE